MFLSVRRKTSLGERNWIVIYHAGQEWGGRYHMSSNYLFSEYRFPGVLEVVDLAIIIDSRGTQRINNQDPPLEEAVVKQLNKRVIQKAGISCLPIPGALTTDSLDSNPGVRLFYIFTSCAVFSWWPSD